MAVYQKLYILAHLLTVAGLQVIIPAQFSIVILQSRLYGWTSENFGGFAGSNAGTITNCYARGAVMELAGSPGQYFGGFVGYNTGSIGYCYETGTVSGTSNAYGFAGFDYNGRNTILSSYYNNANASNGVGDRSTAVRTCRVQSTFHWL